MYWIGRLICLLCDFGSRSGIAILESFLEGKGTINLLLKPLANLGMGKMAQHITRGISSVFTMLSSKLRKAQEGT